VSTSPRIPAELAASFTMLTNSGDTPAAKIAIPAELTRLMGIPIQSENSIQLDPVVHECIRLFNAGYQGCEYCMNARAAVAVQSGLDESLVEKLSRFETSDLPQHIKAALRVTNAMASAPKTLTQAVWDEARRHFSEQEVVDIVLLSMSTTASKVTITLGLDPGKEESSRIFYPTEELYGHSEELSRAVSELENQGTQVRAGKIDYTVKTRNTRAK
jgi:AhpD family alkylhydroperoxidase